MNRFEHEAVKAGLRHDDALRKMGDELRSTLHQMKRDMWRDCDTRSIWSGWRS